MTGPWRIGQKASSSGRVVDLSIRSAQGKTVRGITDADVFAMPGMKR